MHEFYKEQEMKGSSTTSERILKIRGKDLKKPVTPRRYKLGVLSDHEIEILSKLP